MKDTIKGIIIGVVSSLIASGIIYGITEKFLWNSITPVGLARPNTCHSFCILSYQASYTIT